MPLKKVSYEKHLQWAEETGATPVSKDQWESQTEEVQLYNHFLTHLDKKVLTLYMEFFNRENKCGITVELLIEDFKAKPGPNDRTIYLFDDGDKFELHFEMDREDTILSIVQKDIEGEAEIYDHISDG